MLFSWVGVGACFSINAKSGCCLGKRYADFNTLVHFRYLPFIVCFVLILGRVGGGDAAAVFVCLLASLHSFRLIFAFAQANNFPSHGRL